MYPSYETIAAQSGNYPFIEVYQFSNAGVCQFTGADHKLSTRLSSSLNQFEKSNFCKPVAVFGADDNLSDVGIGRRGSDANVAVQLRKLAELSGFDVQDGLRRFRASGVIVRRIC